MDEKEWKRKECVDEIDWKGNCTLFNVFDVIEYKNKQKKVLKHFVVKLPRKACIVKKKHLAF